MEKRFLVLRLKAPRFGQTMNLVDFFAIAPAYFEQGMVLITGKPLGGNFAVLRILRLARIFRVVKVGTFKENLDLVVEALRRSRSGLLLMVYLVVIFMVIMSSIMCALFPHALHARWQ